MWTVGKTSLAKALSTISSTAAFDKNPQSKERGITLDLGFSSFSVPNHHLNDYDSLQFTLVDCPGHASLIRTIIGGAQILDLMMLVVDIQKGIQTQTAECLVIGEITCDTLIVVLNKIDTIASEKRSSSIDKMTKRLRLTLQNTKFKDASIVPVSAFPGENEPPLGISDLIETLKKVSFIPKRDPTGSFLFSVDHCFSIRGQGTVMTGTVLQGTVRLNDNVEISTIKESRKVKGIQMFKKPVEKASQGDRIGICVTQFDAKLLERGIVSTPKTVPIVYAVILQLNKIAYYKSDICTKSKFHFCLGHETVLGRITVFGNDKEEFSLDDEFRFMEKYRSPTDEASENDNSDGLPAPSKQYVLCEFERPISIVPGSQVLGTKLDTDIHANMCRLAFHGKKL
ncbi:selB [Lepeophtheirus salmonis]|uniref:SelB n=1 Tax=Lepeophtheirus salmonis TaxID=72036 RepID=A0A7R8H038_LEPSM|nr:selB [Lepeophtheirus salmonis]CAF2762168.1 selB [Lepeophtheirus salmonis]